MIDFHSHVVFDVDDGAKTIEDSILMIKEASKAGYTDIIATPHYMEGYYVIPKSKIKEKIDYLNKVSEQNGIGVKIHQASEIYFTDSIIQLINNGLASTVNNSKYILLETPMLSEPLNLLQVIYQILEAGKTPIIAHPERYTFIQQDPNKVYNLIEEGVLFQCNMGSLMGLYGKEAKKTITQLLKNNMVHFMGSDTHRPDTIYKNMGKALYELEKILPNDKVIKITYENPQKVLNNEEIEIEEPTEIKNNFLKKFF